MRLNGHASLHDTPTSGSTAAAWEASRHSGVPVLLELFTSPSSNPDMVATIVLLAREPGDPQLMQHMALDSPAARYHC